MVSGIDWLNGVPDGTARVSHRQGSVRRITDFGWVEDMVVAVARAKRSPPAAWGAAGGALIAVTTSLLQAGTATTSRSRSRYRPTMPFPLLIPKAYRSRWLARA